MINSNGRIKVLIVCSGNSGRIAPFISEQADSLMNVGVDHEYFIVKGKGVLGYLGNLKMLKLKIREFSPDLIHAHYGLSALLANLQRKVPVISTYHGSDINESRIFWFSRIAMFLSKHNIYVSEKGILKSKPKSKFSLIPCGVNLDLFAPQDKKQARKKLNWSDNVKYILFSGSFDNQVKNPDLAIKAVSSLENVKLIELKGHSREKVALMMNAADLCLMTSHSEGSPQFIKEAMACNCPIVTVDVGDVAYLLDKVDGCFIAPSNVKGLSEVIDKAMELDVRTNGRDKLMDLRLDLNSVAIKIRNVYLVVLKRNN